MPLRIRMQVEGIREVLAAVRELPPEAQDILRDGSYELSQLLAGRIRSAGMSDSPQSARAAASVKAVRDRMPVIRAGGTKRSSAVLFGSEFGATRKFGWYARGRYYDSAGKQFRPHRGASSYWFFATLEREQGALSAAYRRMADAVIERWSA